MKQRDDYIDVAKGICMLLVVCIHTEVFTVIRIPTFFAVPMFFFLSGCFDKSEYPISRILKKNTKTLLFPAFIWCFIGVLYLSLLCFIKEHTFNFPQISIENPCVGNGPAWFLIALFYVKIFTWCLYHASLPRYFLILFSFAFGYLGSSFQMPLLFDEGFAAFPLYIVGKELYPYFKNILNSSTGIAFGVIALIVCCLNYVYFTISPTGNELYRPDYVCSIICVVFAFIGVMFLSSKCIRFNWILNIGRQSLGIMLVHSLLCHTAAIVLNRLFIKESVFWILTFLMAYFIILIISYYITQYVERRFSILLGR